MVRRVFADNPHAVDPVNTLGVGGRGIEHRGGGVPGRGRVRGE